MNKLNPGKIEFGKMEEEENKEYVHFPIVTNPPKKTENPIVKTIEEVKHPTIVVMTCGSTVTSFVVQVGEEVKFTISNKDPSV